MRVVRFVSVHFVCGIDPLDDDSNEKLDADAVVDISDSESSDLFGFDFNKFYMEFPSLEKELQAFHVPHLGPHLPFLCPEILGIFDFFQ